ISELIKKQGTLHAPDPLFEDTDDDTDDDGTAPGQRAGATGGEGEQDTDRAGTAGQQGGAGGDGGGASWQVARRIETGTVACRYAGAMLVHAFTHRIGAQGLLTAGTGASPRTGTGAGDLGILACTQMSFSLGALTLEQAKHLTAADAGALAGLTSLPSLRTWRQRLGELADRSDPLALQRRLASQMLAIEPAESQVYLADDHLAEYTGHQAVALGRNPRRGKPAKGHDDTYVCDLAGRAISFTTGEPSALCSTLPGALAALTAALPARDKPGRQLSLFEHGKMVAQAISGRLDACPAELIGWLRGRWAEENMFKYDMASYGLDMLADYLADEVVNTKLKANPAATRARKAETKAKTALADAEIALAKLLADPAIPAKTKTEVLIPAAQKKIETCEQALEEAETERKQHRAKLPASQIDPAATRAVLHIRRRCLQLVLRLLAANAEHYLARHLNAY